MVDFLIKNFRLSVRRSCKLAQIPRSTYLYEAKPNIDGYIVKEMEEILSRNPRYGCQMVHLKLRQKGIAYRAYLQRVWFDFKEE